MNPPSAPYLRLLLDALKTPRACAALDEASWDLLVRAARAARLLGVLAQHLGESAVFEHLPERIRHHLQGAAYSAQFQRQMALYEMDCAARVLAPLGMPLILLKGSAYIAQGLAAAQGRNLSDLDLLVPRAHLDRAEQALTAAGWQAEKTDPYDQHYYRAWSHEVPPLRYPGHAFELDLHHTILPMTGRLKPNAAALVQASVAVDGTPFRVLCPADQVLHAAVHLVQDSDCVERLRDLVDIDALVRGHSAAESEFWPRLFDHARLHGLQRPLWYALALSTEWLGTPVPAAMQTSLRQIKPPGPMRMLLLPLARTVLPPNDPEREPSFGVALARRALAFRALWLRMPPWLLAYHSLHKLWRTWTSRPARPADAQN
jgi:hypothetical protein